MPPNIRTDESAHGRSPPRMGHVLRAHHESTAPAVKTSFRAAFAQSCVCPVAGERDIWPPSHLQCAESGGDQHKELSRCSWNPRSFGSIPRASGSERAAIRRSGSNRRETWCSIPVYSRSVGIALRAATATAMVFLPHTGPPPASVLPCGIDLSLSRHDGRSLAVAGILSPLTARARGYRRNSLQSSRAPPQACAPCLTLTMPSCAEAPQLVWDRTNGCSRLLLYSPCGDLPKTRISVCPVPTAVLRTPGLIHSGERIDECRR